MMNDEQMKMIEQMKEAGLIIRMGPNADKVKSALEALNAKHGGIHPAFTVFIQPPSEEGGEEWRGCCWKDEDFGGFAEDIACDSEGGWSAWFDFAVADYKFRLEVEWNDNDQNGLYSLELEHEGHYFKIMEGAGGNAKTVKRFALVMFEGQNDEE
jgi:hypothetical protein